MNGFHWSYQEHRHRHRHRHHCNKEITIPIIILLQVNVVVEFLKNDVEEETDIMNIIAT